MIFFETSPACSLPNTVSKKHSKNDRSDCSFKRCDGLNLTQFMSVPLNVGRNIWGHRDLNEFFS